ncbi:hypothetical protein QBC41DRAFT_329501 [Cercophora samala]|uniref:VWFA domain-containing protein n=1 Tax=Cercophora samala TaxID=330535 RepID=A0AA40D745_9PEZI|nr:hypothetical protein QBC41DRAFT_329501 [Cercophora samala]
MDVASPNHSEIDSRISSKEDEFAFLSIFDIVFLIDDSGSMDGSRWREAQTTIKSLIPICVEHDADGVDLHYLHKKNRKDESAGWREMTDASEIDRLFSAVKPAGGTPTGKRLNDILDPYVKLYEMADKAKRKEIKPLLLVVITDGEANDDVDEVIINIADRLNEVDAPRHQVGIQFFQVGDDEKATEHLKHLDEGLKCSRDIVDTCSFDQRCLDTGERTLTGYGVLKTLLGSVQSKYDKERLPVKMTSTKGSTSRNAAS